MTEEKLIIANDLFKSIKWADNILNHWGNDRRFSLRVDTTRDCIESHEMVACPNWLRDIIHDAVSDKKKEWQEEFENL